MKLKPSYWKELGLMTALDLYKLQQDNCDVIHVILEKGIYKCEAWLKPPYPHISRLLAGGDLD